MRKYIFPMLTVFTLVAGCSASPKDQVQSSNEQPEKSAPVLTYKIGSDDWSVIKSNTDSPKILEAYQFAVAHPEVLNYIPCYCGCNEEEGHTNNTDCFVESTDGAKVTLDTMGFG
ncbi:Protein of unknown function with PCYCGC motif-containing protein [Bacillus sp. UNCCL13]|nr:Protein of unknown function with PCYCGC motif-containing protein [Bacillus sp. UNCCL13]